ncbi:helix-turn-helix transcriptional regulator [Sphaerisporangium sp. NPDC051011]|uniref:helix-turn-helix domain-containing protein n=1 Tax=Sphaerisporangium sp. NPDC051011 TaxID=3155792 RepID=UPI0033C580C7
MSSSLPTPYASARQARQDLANRLREMRLDAGLTARAVAAAAGWHESKTSRIEHGHKAPSDSDIRAWCTACGQEDQVADLIATARTANSMYVEWRRRHRAGLRHIQQSGIPLYQATRHFRVYCSNVIPGLLQTPGYARAMLTAFGAFHGTADGSTDIDGAVAARMERSRVLFEGNRRFAVLVEDSVLYYPIADAEVMAGQLGHLLALMALPSVSLGVIPRTAPRRMWTCEAFNIFDDDRVFVELLSASLTITAPHEVELYVKGFARLAETAVYGAPARALITAAIERLH